VTLRAEPGTNIFRSFLQTAGCLISDKSIKPNAGSTPPPMKSFLHPLLAALAVGLALAPVIVRGAGMNINVAVDRLDKLVSLTAAQKVQAAQVFTDQNSALLAFTSEKDRMIKGPPIWQNARAQVRAILTPAQQKIYDATPQRLGGGAMQDPAAITTRLDKVVALTDDQVALVAAIYQKQTDDLQALSAGDRASGQGAAIRQAAKAQVRALLTPEQQQKFDANPNGAENLEERAFVNSFLKSSPAIAARLGPITRLTPVERIVTTSDVSEQIYAKAGSYLYRVQGSTGTETLNVYWEKTSPSAPVKIESSTGETIPP
jgi:hypothetical protein